MTEKKTTSTKAKTRKAAVKEAPVASFTPPSGIRVCAPIKRIRKGNPVSHETNFKYGKATNTYVLPIINVNGRKQFMNPFHSREEQDYLAEALGEDLNTFKKDNSFLEEFQVELGKNKEEFDLSNPVDLLSVRILECWKDEVCLNPEDRMSKLTYKYILSEDGYQEIESEQLADRKIELMAFYKSIKTSKSDLVSFLRMRSLQPPSSADVKWLAARVFEEMEANPTECYALITDENREWRILMDRALSARAIIVSEDGYMFRDHVDTFATNKDNAILYIKDPRNSEELQTVRAQIKEYEDNNA